MGAEGEEGVWMGCSYTHKKVTFCRGVNPMKRAKRGWPVSEERVSRTSSESKVPVSR